MAGNSRARTNFVLEGVTLLVLMCMVATGLIMEYRLPAGSGGGRGMGAPTLLGYGRHDWGEIHLWLAFGMLALLALHLWMHWRWIWGLVRGPVARRHNLRATLFVLGTLAMLLLAAAPWMVPVETMRGAGERRGAGFGRGAAYELDDDDALTTGSAALEHRPRRMRGGHGD
jgi:hypothetical protein